MDAKPVEHSRQPAYPTRREVLAGAASFAMIAFSEGELSAAEAPAEKAIVAPIFEHGEGRGAGGCVVITPPVYLSEEEALQIVKEELAKHGVQLESGVVLKDLTIAPRRVQQVEDDEKSKKKVPLEDQAAPLRLSGMDAKKSIAVEFVGWENYRKLGGVDSYHVDIVNSDGEVIGTSACSVRECDCRDAATYVAAEIGRKGKQRLYVGVLFDPVGHNTLLRDVRAGKTPKAKDFKSAVEEMKKAAAEESKKLLRQQAQDFAAWLKQQKAI
jgi:hypothetical protein